MADQVLVMGGDFEQYIQAAKKARGETKGMAKDASGIGGEIIKATAKMEVLKRAAEAAGRAISGVLQAGVESSKRQGSNAVSMATSLSSLGVQDITGASDRLLKATGAASTEDRVGFLERLASLNKQRQSPMSSEEALAAATAYTTGGDLMFGKGGEDIAEGLSKGRTVADITKDAAARRPGLAGLLNNPNGSVMTELGLRAAEDSSRIFGDESRAAAGAQVRAGAAANDLTTANNKGADIFRAMVGAIPGVGDAFDAQTGKTAVDRMRDDLGIQTTLMRRQLTQPNLSTTTNGAQ